MSQPVSASDLFTSAVRHFQAGRLPPAEAALRRVIALQPNHPDGLHLLALIAASAGRHAEAADLLRKLIAVAPNFAEAHYNLGRVHRSLGQIEEAVACYRRATSLKPDFADAHCNLGNALRDVRRLDDAVASCRRAIALRPDFVEALGNLGNALRDLGRFEEAAASYRRVVAIKPDLAEAHFNLGMTLRDIGQVDEAMSCLGRALALKPDYLEALDELVFLRRKACDWAGLDSDAARMMELAERGRGVVRPFHVLCTTASPELHLVTARRWARARVVDGGRPFAHARPDADRRIRVGYLSADFHAHATAYLMAELFERHDRQRFETFGYSCGRDDGSAMRRRLQAGFHHFIDLQSVSDGDAAKRIHGDGIDILVDLKGYTQNARPGILARRPAPIQVNWLGYPGTVGADFDDYILVDPFVVPPDRQPFFAEKLVHLPHCYQPNDSKRSIAERLPTRADCGLPDDAFVFCCFNHDYKITPRFFAIWMRLLTAVPGSVLWLLGDDWAMRRNLAREAAARGVDPARLVFALRLPLADHLARHRLADLFLDTLPYNAHTTASDALWAGLPVLTVVGECFPGRVAGSLLHAVGLPELVTQSEEDYEALAVKLATDTAFLGHLRQRLAANRRTAPLFDCAGFARALENAFEIMWQRWRSGAPPAAFPVPPPLAAK